MKKIFGLILFLFLSTSTLHAATVDRYPFTITSDTTPFTTSAAKAWKWLGTRIKFEANTTATIFHILDSGDATLHDGVIDQQIISASTDTVCYPGATGDTAEVLLRNTDELKVVVSGTSNRPRITILGEEI